MDYVQLTMLAIVFSIALYILLKGVDLVMASTETIGRSRGIASVAVVGGLVGFITALPELAIGVMAAIAGVSEVVTAAVVGSNNIGILLIVGIMAVLAGRILIDPVAVKAQLPMFVVAQMALVAVILDAVVSRLEAGFLLVVGGVYLWQVIREAKTGIHATSDPRPKIAVATIGTMVLGLLGVLVGAYFVIDVTTSVVTAIALPIGLLAMTLIALGAALPEFLVALRALKQKNTDLALGIIVSSVVCNSIMVLGLPAAISPVTVDTTVLSLGAWVMLATSLLFLIIVLSGQLFRFVGVMMIIGFVFFLTKLAMFL